MNKKLKSVVLALLAGALTFSMAACFGGDGNKDGGNNGGYGNNGGEEEVEGVAMVKNYLADMKVEQASTVVEDADGNKVVQNAKLMNSQRIGDLVFLQYNIGKATNCFVQNLSRPIYHDGTVKEITYSESNVTSQSISKGVGSLISTTDSVSVSTSEKNTVSWGISESVEVGTSASVGVEMGIVKSSVEVSQKFSMAAEYCNTSESERAETIEKSATNEYTSSYDMQDFKENCKQWGTSFDIGNLPQGKYYAVSLVTDVEVYQVIAYNVVKGQFVSSYFASEIQTDYNHASIRILSSENSTFDITPEYQLSPITEINIEEIAIGEEAGETVTIDMTSCYTYEGASVENFEHDYYDKETGVFTVYGSMNNKKVDKYVFKGLHGMQDSKGQWVRTTINGFSICVKSEHDIELCFENMSFIGLAGMPAVYKSTETENKLQAITISANGVGSYIYGSDGSNTDGNVAVDITTLLIAGEGDLWIQGGDGASATSQGGSGKNGNVAVRAESILIDAVGDISFVGGNGGSGMFGATGYRPDDGNQGADGGDGGHGGNGGNGALPVACTTFHAGAGNILLKSGNGGNGGNGGDGGAANHNTSGTPWNFVGTGGDGGNGGNGGNTYICEASSIATSYERGTASVTFETGSVGTKGVGGSGGAKGTGGGWIGTTGDPKDGNAGTNGIDGQCVKK